MGENKNKKRPLCCGLLVGCLIYLLADCRQKYKLRQTAATSVIGSRYLVGSKMNTPLNQKAM